MRERLGLPRWRRVLLVMGVPLAAATMLLVSASPSSAGASHPPQISGNVYFGAPTVGRICAEGSATQVTYSVSYDGLQLRSPAEGDLVAYFDTSNFNDPQISSTPLHLIVLPGTVGTFSETIDIPPAAAGYTIADIVFSNGPTGFDYTFTPSVDLTCSSPEPPVPTTPPKMSASFVCGGDVTVTFDATASTVDWQAQYSLLDGGFGEGPAIPAGKVTSFDAGPTSAGEFGVQEVSGVNPDGTTTGAFFGASAIFNPPACSGVTTFTGRAYALSANAYLLNQSAPLIPRTVDTKPVVTMSSTTTKPQCASSPSSKLLCADVVTNAAAGRSTATATVASLTVSIPNWPALPSIEIRAVQARSTTSCAGSTGAVQVAYLRVGTHVLITSATTLKPNTRISLGAVTIVLNEQVPFSTPDRGLTVNALHVFVGSRSLSGADVIVGSAESDIGGC